jgi:hypothetical protein
MTDKNYYLEEAARIADQCAKQNRDSLDRARRKAATLRLMDMSEYGPNAETFEILAVELEAAATEADAIAAMIRQLKD